MAIDFSAIERHPDDAVRYGVRAGIAALCRGNMRRLLRRLRAVSPPEVSPAAFRYCLQLGYLHSVTPPEPANAADSLVIAMAPLLIDPAPPQDVNTMSHESFASMLANVIAEVIATEFPPDPNPEPK
jgi:hypothetical protein